MEHQTSAPPVVAVVVARDPGECFEEALAALAAQDYPNQSVLVIDAGSRVDPGPRVAAVLPDAYLRRAGDRGGFAGAANDVLQSVQGAAYLLFCHSDCAPDPDAVRCMVEEALRSNAGVVGPKLVEWDRPEHLLEVGLAVDKTGACESLVERGELDQEQHDPVRDVFAVSTSCMLVRADLFSALDGFDASMGNYGADVDLCWRAQVAGARVLVAPAARVRHREEGLEATGADPDRGAMSTRNHLRAMLKSYSLLHLLRVVPQAAVVTLVEAMVAVFSRHWPEARRFSGAWWSNFRHLGELRQMRRSVQRARTVPDAEVRRLQARGSVRFSAYLRRHLHAEDRAQALLTAGQRLVGSVGRGPARAATALLAILTLALIIGSRELWSGRIPAVGQLAPFPKPGALLRHYVDGWRTTGMGSGSAAPPSFALLSGAGTLLFGNMDLLRTTIVLGAWPVGAWGIWRLGGRLQSTLGRLVGVVAYLVVPLPYNAVAQGRWGGVLAYAAMPWVLILLLRFSRAEPFSAEMDREWWSSAAFRLDVLKLGILLAVVSAFVPAVALAVVLAALGLLAGSALTGATAGSVRAVGATVVAVTIAAVLLVPWSFDVIANGEWSTVAGVAGAGNRAPSLGALLRFETGPLGAAPIGWALPVVAALPLFVARGWRLAWAARLWMVAIVCVVVAWTGGRGWLPLRFQTPEVLLAPAAAALATAAALGAVAFTVDLRRQRFGWRQAGSVTAGGVLALASLPILGAIPDGRWNAPASEMTRSVSWMPPLAANGAFRVLWLGDPAVLPLDGWPLASGVAYATSRNGPPDITDLLPGPPSAATRAMGRAVRTARSGDTVRLGRLLAPMSVRYIVVPQQLSAGDREPEGRRPPGDLSRGLSAQLDLRLLPSDPSLAVYENVAWGPARAAIPHATAEATLRPNLGAGVDLNTAQPVMTGGGPVTYRGAVPAGAHVLFSETPATDWELKVEGRRAVRSQAFGVANSFRSDRGGTAVLRLQPQWVHYLALVLNAALWVVAIRTVVRLRRTRRLEEPAGS